MDFVKEFCFDPAKPLADYQTDYSGRFINKQSTDEIFQQGIIRLRQLQDMLYAQGRYGVLIILQALDAAGKDGIIKHVISGVNPQGCQVKSFKIPSAEELSHDFMWRCVKALPQRGNISIFNRSYYEEVLVVRVHPAILLKQNIPGIESIGQVTETFWETRFRDISNFERYFTNNGFLVLKFFLNISRAEQKKRFLSRINEPAKNWKFTMGDVNERQHFDKYISVYEDMMRNTSHGFAPWYVIPADKKWFMRTAVCHIIVDQLENLSLSYPYVGPQHLNDMRLAKELLDSETE